MKLRLRPPHPPAAARGQLAWLPSLLLQRSFWGCEHSPCSNALLRFLPRPVVNVAPVGAHLPPNILAKIPGPAFVSLDAVVCSRRYATRGSHCAHLAWHSKIVYVRARGAHSFRTFVEPAPRPSSPSPAEGCCCASTHSSRFTKRPTGDITLGFRF